MNTTILSRWRTVAAAAVLSVGLPFSASADLSVGDRAPDFKLVGSDGRVYTLQSVLAESRGVVLAWFPKAFTSG